ncbi:LPS export ABC transporter periplasmic protein LptC [candidate division KSB1 bacterium]|nr:LPS export ABC transporter periplasmic protein LptC [candidate division KSB1 bacterium]
MKIQRYRIFLFLALGILLISGCGDSQSDSSALVGEQKEYPTQEGWNSTYRISHAGRPQAVIQYGHMSQYESQKISYFDEGVIVDFFDETGKHSSKLTSNRGIYNEETNDVFGIGNVVVVSDTGVTLYTEKIRWDQTREKILSDTLVTVVTEDSDTLYGRGFESTPDLSKMVFRETWGKTDKRVDFEKVESELAKSPESDSVSTEQMESDSMSSIQVDGDSL